MIDCEQKPEYIEWIGRKLGCDYSNGVFTTIAHLDDSGEILCVVLYSNWVRSGCEMVIASSSPKWCTRDFMRVAFGYVFNQSKRDRVTFIVEEHNLKSLSLCDRLGAKPEGVLRKWFGKTDGIIFGMLKEECKWIKETGDSHSSQERE